MFVDREDISVLDELVKDLLAWHYNQFRLSMMTTTRMIGDDETMEAWDVDGDGSDVVVDDDMH